jgi:hypothetical protein
MRRHALDKRIHPSPPRIQSASRRSAKNHDATHHSTRNLPLTADVANPNNAHRNKTHSSTPPPFRQEDLEFSSPSALLSPVVTTPQSQSGLASLSVPLATKQRLGPQHNDAINPTSYDPSALLRDHIGSDIERRVSRKRTPEAMGHQDLERTSSAKRACLDRVETQLSSLSAMSLPSPGIEALTFTTSQSQEAIVTAHNLRPSPTVVPLVDPVSPEQYFEPEDDVLAHPPTPSYSVASDDDGRDLRIPDPIPPSTTQQYPSRSSHANRNQSTVMAGRSPEGLNHELIDDELLRPFGFAINRPWNICVCLTCEIAVAPDQLINHSSTHSKTIKLTTDDVVSLVTKYHLTHPDSTPNPTTEVAPLAGLELSHGAFHCRVLDKNGCRCTTICFGAKMRQNHMSDKHQGVAPRGTSLDAHFWEANCSYQNFFPHRRRLFRVYPELTPADEEDHFSSYYLTAKSALEDRSEFVPENLQDRRDVNVWLAESGWLQVTDGYNDWQALIGMVTLNDRIGTVLEQACRTFVVDMADKADNSITPVRKWLLSTSRCVLAFYIDFPKFIVILFSLQRHG